ncbi:MAG: DNA-binding response regulator [Verrucomicrobia bacterium]|nr:MAG: DNA-binding response regulator [Verrucomicrobiota bacterium]
METAKIRILVLDDQPLLRYGISGYLNSQPDMMVCGEAESIADVRSKIAECQPQVLVTALRLGAEDSLKLIKKLKTETPQLRILVYSALAETIFAERAMRAKANGYVMKQAAREELAIAVREIVKGGIYVSRQVALSAFQKSLQPRPKNNRMPRSGAWLEELSNREMHIFQLLGSGFGNRQIATSLGLSVKTIDSHQENIKHKLHLRSCAQLRERAAKWVEQTFDAEEYVSRDAGQQRNWKLPARRLRVVEAFAASATPDSELAAGTSAAASQPVRSPPAPYARNKGV